MKTISGQAMRDRLLKAFNPSFNEFQNLEEHIQDALAIIVAQSDINKAVRAAVSHLLYHYPDQCNSSSMIVIDIMLSVQRLVADHAIMSMARCYVDHDRDMMRAKLAWKLGY